jgi:hypothetical protein
MRMKDIEALNGDPVVEVVAEVELAIGRLSAH